MSKNHNLKSTTKYMISVTKTTIFLLLLGFTSFPLLSQSTLALRKKILLSQEEEFISQAFDFTITEEENIFINDIKEQNIKLYDQNGSFIKSWKMRGQGPGEYLQIDMKTKTRKIFSQKSKNYKKPEFRKSGQKESDIETRQRNVSWVKGVFQKEYILEESSGDYSKEYFSVKYSRHTGCLYTLLTREEDATFEILSYYISL